MALSKVSTNQIDTAATPTVAEATVSGDLTVDTNTLVVDASANKVGINEATPSLADLEIYNSTEAGGTMLALVGESNNTTDTSGYTVRNSILFGGQATTDTRSRIDGVHNRAAILGGEIVFNTCTTAGSLTEKARILANGGLTFNGDTATANALDDYEEGTHTFAEKQGEATITTNRSHYVKIGKLVFVQASINVGSNTDDDAFNLTLPFSSAVNGYYLGGGSVGYHNLESTYYNVRPNIENAANNVFFYYGGGTSTLSCAQMSGHRIDFAISYVVS